MTFAQTSATPILRVGDTWHYHYTGSESDSTEQIVRSETCGLAQCVVDQENNSAWNDTVVLTEDWNLSREYFADHTTPFNSSNFYTPALHLYQFPLQTGESWWWNSSISGWYKDLSGNHTETGNFSVMRKVINQTTVTVPAGNFDTFLVAGYSHRCHYHDHADRTRNLEFTANFENPPRNRAVQVWISLHMIRDRHNATFRA